MAIYVPKGIFLMKSLYKAVNADHESQAKAISAQYKNIIEEMYKERDLSVP